MPKGLKRLLILKGVVLILCAAEVGHSAGPSPSCVAGLNFLVFSDRSIFIMKPDVQFTAEEINHSILVLSKKYYRGSTQRVSGTRSFSEELPSSFLNKVNETFDFIGGLYSQDFGHAPKDMSANLRITSNTFGHSITPRNGGDPINGLHVHGGGVASARAVNISFVWAIRGAGPRIEFPDGNIQEMPEGSIAFFGNNVRHGSPHSDDLRLIAVGTIVN